MEKKTWIAPEVKELWGEDTMGGRNLFTIEATAIFHT